MTIPFRLGFATVLERDSTTPALRGIGQHIKQLETIVAKFGLATRKSMDTGSAAVKEQGNLLAALKQKWLEVTGAIATVSKALLDYAREERSITQLTRALRLHGISWEEARERVERFTETREQLTGFADVVTREFMAQVATITAGAQRSTITQLEQLAVLAQNIVAIMPERSLNEVSRQLGRVLGGNLEVLNELVPMQRDYITQLVNTENQSTRARIGMELLNEAYGDGATAQGATSIAIHAMQSAFRDLMEIVGKVVAPTFKLLTSIVKSFRDTVETLGPVFDLISHAPLAFLALVRRVHPAIAAMVAVAEVGLKEVAAWNEQLRNTEQLNTQTGQEQLENLRRALASVARESRHVSTELAEFMRNVQIQQISQQVEEVGTLVERLTLFRTLIHAMPHEAAGVLGRLAVGVSSEISRQVFELRQRWREGEGDYADYVEALMRLADQLAVHLEQSTKFTVDEINQQRLREFLFYKEQQRRIREEAEDTRMSLIESSLRWLDQQAEDERRAGQRRLDEQRRLQELFWRLYKEAVEREITLREEQAERELAILIFIFERRKQLLIAERIRQEEWQQAMAAEAETSQQNLRRVIEIYDAGREAEEKRQRDLAGNAVALTSQLGGILAMVSGLREVEYSIEAAGETARAFASIAIGDAWGAAAHFLAATKFILAAALAGQHSVGGRGARGRGGGGGGGGAARARPPLPERPRGDQPDRGISGATFHIDMRGAVGLDGRRAAEGIMDALIDWGGGGGRFVPPRLLPRG